MFFKIANRRMERLSDMSMVTLNLEAIKLDLSIYIADFKVNTLFSLPDRLLVTSSEGMHL